MNTPKLNHIDEGVKNVIEQYFDALYYADSKAMKGIFHAEGRYINASTSSYVNLSLNEYLDVLDGRVAPAKMGDARQEQVLSVREHSNEMLFIEATMVMMQRQYQDFLTLINVKGKWLIVSKVFSYKPFQS